MSCSEIRAWWRNTLRDEQRLALMALPSIEVPPEMALELWRHSGRLKVIEGTPDPHTRDGYRWLLTPEVAHFVADQDQENHRPGLE